MAETVTSKTSRAHRASTLNKVQKHRAAKRELHIPPIVDLARRDLCRDSLLRFADTYFEHLYYLPRAQHQIDRMVKMERLIHYGGQAVDAEPRGSGKTTDAMVAGLWAILYGHKRHFFVIRANEAEAAELITDAKKELETNDMLLEDFPEVCAPIRALDGSVQRARYQTVNGKRTRLGYKATAIVFPTVDGSACAGSVLSSTGITGKIRGRKINGIRPDFVLLDDIEDPESAVSHGPKGQIEKFRGIITKDVGGLAGPGRKISFLWRGTVLARRCLIDEYTDRTQHPEWEGTRTAAIIAWPDAFDTFWAEYFDALDEGRASGDDPTGRRAMALYKNNRKIADAGAIIAWMDNYITDPGPDGAPLEISGLQSLMNKYHAVGRDAFLTEYQNAPPDEPGASGITADVICSRLSMFPQNVAPVGQHERVVQFIDVGGREIHYAVLACAANYTGTFIDYGILNVRPIDGADLRDPSGPARPALERAVLDTLRWRREEISGDANPYKDAEGNPIEVQLTLIDSGWLSDTIYKFILESGPRYRATKGHQAVVGNSRYSPPGKDAKAVRAGNNWHVARTKDGGFPLWHVNADYWKLFAHERFLQAPGTDGAITLYGNTPRLHRMFASHLLAEEWRVELNKWEQVGKWNHFFDCSAGCFCAADMAGCRLIGKPAERQRTDVIPARQNAANAIREKTGWKIGR